MHAYGPENWLEPSQLQLLFGYLPNLESTIRCSQFLQAEGLRYANQSMRRRQWHRSAFTSWPYNEPWPNAAHGCVVEHYGKPKMAYYYFKQSCANVDISAVYPGLSCTTENPLDLKLWVANNLGQPLKGQSVRYRIYTTRKGIVVDQTKSIQDIESDKAVEVMNLNWRHMEDSVGDVAMVYIELLAGDKTVTPRNLYTFGVQGPDNPLENLFPERKKIPLEKQRDVDQGRHLSEEIIKKAKSPLKALLSAPAAQLKLKTKWQQTKPRYMTAEIEVTNTSRNPALFVNLSADIAEGARAYYSDNYFFLPPGESRRVQLSINADRAPSFKHPPKITATAWNCRHEKL